MWVKRELTYALNQKRFQSRIVPVLHHRCDYEELHWVLASSQIVDLTGDFAGGCRELLKVWGLAYRPVNSLRLMDGAMEVKCSAFGDNIIAYM